MQLLTTLHLQTTIIMNLLSQLSGMDCGREHVQGAVPCGPLEYRLNSSTSQASLWQHNGVPAGGRLTYRDAKTQDREKTQNASASQFHFVLLVCTLTFDVGSKTHSRKSVAPEGRPGMEYLILGKSGQVSFLFLSRSRSTYIGSSKCHVKFRMLLHSLKAVFVFDYRYISVAKSL